MYFHEFFFLFPETICAVEESLSQLTHRELFALLFQLWGKSPEIQRLILVHIYMESAQALSLLGNGTRDGENDFASVSSHTRVAYRSSISSTLLHIS